MVIRKCSQERTVVGREDSSFGTPTCQDMSLGAEELKLVEVSESTVAE
jgi:hypothetical protein